MHIIFLCVLIVILIVIIYLLLPNSPTKILFMKRANDMISEGKMEEGQITEALLKDLPKPLFKYYQASGFIDKRKMLYLVRHCNQALISLKKGKLGYKGRYQTVTVADQIRTVGYFKGMMKGLPLEIIDDYYNVFGNAKGVVAKHIPLFYQECIELSQGYLVALLMETLFMPTLAIQSFIEWDQIDAHHVKGSISRYTLKVSGIFTFDETGKCIEFASEDRITYNAKGELVSAPWKVQFSDYQEIDGYNLPRKVKVISKIDATEHVNFIGQDIIYEYGYSRATIA